MKRESALVRLRRKIAACIGVVCALCFAVSCLAFPAVSQALEQNAAPAPEQYSNTRAMKPINTTKYFIQFVDIESRQILFVNSVEQGGSIYAPLPKSRPGYTFIGWKTSSGEVYRPGDMIRNITSAMVLSAVWEKTAYTVTYQWKGRTPAGVLLPESSSVYWDESPQLDEMFNEGYAVQDTMVDALGNSHTGVWFFTGWHAIQGLDEQGHAIGNVIYEGEWSFGATDDTDNSSGDRSAGSDPSNTAAGDADEPSDPNLPSDNDSDKPLVDIDPNPDTGIGDVGTIMRVLTLHMGAEESRSVLAQEGKPFQLPVLADTPSEHFVGWRAAGDNATYADSYPNVQSDLVFDPIWEPRKFTLQYQWQHGAPQGIALPDNRQDITYGEAVGLPQMPLLGYRERGIMDGQTGTWIFNGWHALDGVSEDNNTALGDVTIEGVWDFEADEPTPVDPDPSPVDPDPDPTVDPDPVPTDPVDPSEPEPTVDPEPTSPEPTDPEPEVPVEPDPDVDNPDVDTKPEEPNNPQPSENPDPSSDPSDDVEKEPVPTPTVDPEPVPVDPDPNPTVDPDPVPTDPVDPSEPEPEPEVPVEPDPEPVPTVNSDPTPVDPDSINPEVPEPQDQSNTATPQEPTPKPETTTDPVTEPKPHPNVQPVQPAHGEDSVILPQDGAHTTENNSGQEEETSAEQSQGTTAQSIHTQRTNLASRQASDGKTMQTWRDIFGGSGSAAHRESHSNTNTKVSQRWLTQSDLGSPTQSDSAQQSHRQEPLVLDSALAHDTKPRYEVNINPDIDGENDTAQVSEFHRATQNASLVAAAAGVVAVGAGGVALFTGIRRRFFPGIKHN